MTDTQDRSRRRFVAGAAMVAVGGISGCIGDGGNDNGGSDGDGNDGDSDGNDRAGDDGADDGTGGPTASETDGRDTRNVPVAETSPEEVVRKMLRASAAGDRETVRRLTVDGHSLRQVGQADDLTIESIQRHSAESYADRTGVADSAVEEPLQAAVDRGYDDATIVSYTVSTAEYDAVQRDYILVLDGDQWLMFDFGRVPQ